MEMKIRPDKVPFYKPCQLDKIISLSSTRLRASLFQKHIKWLIEDKYYDRYELIKVSQAGFNFDASIVSRKNNPKISTYSESIDITSQSTSMKTFIG